MLRKIRLELCPLQTSEEKVRTKPEIQKSHTRSEENCSNFYRKVYLHVGSHGSQYKKLSEKIILLSHKMKTLHNSKKHQALPSLRFLICFWVLCRSAFKAATLKHLQDTTFPAALRGNTRRENPSWGQFGIHEHDWWHKDGGRVWEFPTATEKKLKLWLFGIFPPDRAALCFLVYICKSISNVLMFANWNVKAWTHHKSIILRLSACVWLSGRSQ